MTLKIRYYLEQLQPKYHLHIEKRTGYPHDTHQHQIKSFAKAMNLRCLRRQHPTYLRLTNIEDHTQGYTQNYRYISDILTSSMTLLSELCAQSRGHVIIECPRINLQQLLKCFPYPIHIETIGSGMFQVVDHIHPLVLLNTLLQAFPKSIDRVRFGMTHTLNLTPCVDDMDYFHHDPMPFPYKRLTSYQPIRYRYENH